jgi:hypothetical protein
MLEQLTGAASILVLVLAYLLIVQALMAAVVLLAQYIVVQVRNLRGMIPNPQQSPVVESRSYQVGGGIRRWE